MPRLTLERAALDHPVPPAPEGSTRTAQRSAGTVVVLVLVDFAPGSLLWGWSRLVRGRQALAGIAGLRWAQVLGSGAQGGFGLQPSRSRQGLMLGFDDEAAARHCIAASAELAAYRAHARECCVALLRVASCRGSWGGAAFEVSACVPAHGWVASLT
ncbi:MAG: spheroidene monooxygenase, partial [Leptothrix sp. (in: b-proteobacteria)]